MQFAFDIHKVEFARPLVVNHQRCQFATVNRAGIDACGMFEPGRAIHEGLVPKDDMAEPAVIDFCPERVLFGLFSEPDECACLVTNKSGPPDAFEIFSSLPCGGVEVAHGRELRHVSRYAGMEREHVQFGQSEIGKRCFKKLPVVIACFAVKASKDGALVRLAFCDARPQCEVSPVPDMFVLVIAAYEPCLDVCASDQLLDPADDA